jgi:hypothetical protein
MVPIVTQLIKGRVRILAYFFITKDQGWLHGLVTWAVSHMKYALFNALLSQP